MNEQQYNEQEIRARRAQRIQQMKKEKQRRIMIQNCIKIATPIVIVILLVGILVSRLGKNSEASNSNVALAQSQIQEDITSTENSAGTTEILNGSLQQELETLQQSEASEEISQQDDASMEETSQQNDSSQGKNMASKPDHTIYSATATENTIQLGDDIVSQHAIFIDLESGNILARKDANAIINPASMTKILTVLVAAEHITEAQLDDTFTMTLEITDYGYVNDCSSAGFLDGETVTVRDLFYGTILPSGADAAVGLATYVAGSQEAFVEMMNDKLKEMGLSETAHFTNCVGLYDKDHYCTVYDMAMIMEAAIANDISREALTAHTYTTSATEQHPEGIILSNWFLRRIEDKDTGGEVICAKTGYVVQSGNCAASYGRDNGGKEYICVTAAATSNWKCIYDHVAIYKKFATGDAGADEPQ